MAHPKARLNVLGRELLVTRVTVTVRIPRSVVSAPRRLSRTSMVITPRSFSPLEPSTGSRAVREGGSASVGSARGRGPVQGDRSLIRGEVGRR